MNHFKSLSDPQISTKEILDKKLDKLLNKAYNPIKGQFSGLNQLSKPLENTLQEETIPIDQFSPTTPI